jgi:hypothetical protein
MRTIDFPETSVTTNLHCITSQKNEGFIHSAAEAWNQVQVILKRTKKKSKLFFVTDLHNPAKSPTFKTLDLSPTVPQCGEVSASYIDRATDAVYGYVC